MKSDKNTLIFDFGSVLICGDFDKALRQDPKIPNEYIEEIKKAWIVLDNPKFTETCTKEEYIKYVMNNSDNNIKYYIPVVADISISHLEVLSHTHLLLNELKESGYKLYYLSNWNKWSVEELKHIGKFDFLRYFDGGIFSYETGYMKPDEKIYRILLKKYNIDPNDAIFFDDKKENIEAANKLGIEGVIFNKDTGDNILKDFILNESINEDKSLNTIIQETSMSTKERDRLKDSEFGIPELRKYPLHDRKHVEQAIKMFNHVDKKHETELADNILDAMEKYNISKDSIGEKNRLSNYINEYYVDIPITEGLIWNDNTPEDIKKLKENIKDEVEKARESVDIVDNIKDASKDKDFSAEEKNTIVKILKKLHFSIKGYSIVASQYGATKISNTHEFLGTYKNYILSIKFISTHGVIALGTILIKYSEKICNIPKNVAFDILNMLSPDVDDIKCTRRSIKVSAFTKAIDSGYPRIDHKYRNKYKVKKGTAGMSIVISTMNYFKEDSVVAAALPPQNYQPDAVYIVNYLMKNTFESDIAICKDKMSSIFISKDNKPVPISLSDFKEMVSETKVYQFIGDASFNQIIKHSESGLDFYRNLVEDNSVTLESLAKDYRFNKVTSYIDELNSLEECVINSCPKQNIINEIYCPNIPLIDENLDESCVHYFRDIDGIYAQNINTLARSSSYRSLNEIPNTTINLLKNI